MIVLINGIDMPECCEECFFNDAVGNCWFLDDVDESIANGSRDLRCPLEDGTPYEMQMIVEKERQKDGVVCGI